MGTTLPDHADVIAALGFVLSMSATLSTICFLFVVLGLRGGHFHDRAERHGQLERRHRLIRLGGRGVDRLVHGFDVIVPDGQVHGLWPNADGDIRLLAQAFPRRFLIFRNGNVIVWKYAGVARRRST